MEDDEAHIARVREALARARISSEPAAADPDADPTSNHRGDALDDDAPDADDDGQPEHSRPLTGISYHPTFVLHTLKESPT